MSEKQINPEYTIGPLMPKSFETGDPHITARQITVADAEVLYGLSQDKDIREYLPWAPEIDSVADAESKIADWEGRDGLVRYLVSYDNKGVGVVGAWIDRHDSSKCETGSALDPKYRGKGIIPKVHMAIEPLLKNAGMKGVISHVDPRNFASQTMALKRGFTEVSRTAEKIRYEKAL